MKDLVSTRVDGKKSKKKVEVTMEGNGEGKWEERKMKMKRKNLPGNVRCREKI